MVLELSERSLQGLGDTPPLIASTKTNQIAEPNTTLESDGARKGRKADWTCNDWVIFHKSLVLWFKQGRFASRKKYSDADALTLSNQVFRQHWDRASWTLTRCGYASDFAAYFKSVGLSEILNFAQRAFDSTKTKTAKIADSVTNTAVNVIDDAGNIVHNAGGAISNVTGAAKYILPVAIGGVVLFVGAYAYKNFIKGDSRISVPTPGGALKV